MKLDYARVSTEDQRLDLQRARLNEVGCGRLFEEKISGAARQRPALEQLLREMRANDILVVTVSIGLRDRRPSCCGSPRPSLINPQVCSHLRSLGRTQPALPDAWS